MMARITTFACFQGALLKHHRHARKLSQVTLADAIDVSQAAWSRIEAGEGAVLRVDALARVALVFGTTAAALLAETDALMAVAIAEGHLQQVLPAGAPWPDAGEWAITGTTLEVLVRRLSLARGDARDRIAAQPRPPIEPPEGCMYFTGRYREADDGFLVRVGDAVPLAPSEAERYEWSRDADRRSTWYVGPLELAGPVVFFVWQDYKHRGFAVARVGQTHVTAYACGPHLENLVARLRACHPAEIS